MSSEPAPGTGGVSLNGAAIKVQGNGVALVKLECLGSASCRGKLTLSAKGTVRAKGVRLVEMRAAGLRG